MPEITDPIKRIEECKRNKVKMTEELLGLGLKTIDRNHRNVLTNVFCQMAAPHSIKQNGGIVLPIDIDDFMHRDIYDILSLRPPRLRKEMAREISEKESMTNVVAQRGRNALQPINIGGRGRLTGLSTYPHHFGIVANFVPGLKDNYVPFIKMHKSRRVDLNDIKEDLGDLLIFGEENHYWLIGYKLFQKDKLLKVMQKLKASNCMEFQKRYAKFRFTNILDSERKQIAPPPKLLHKVKSKKAYTYSLAHRNFFKEFDAQEKMYGRAELKTYEAVSRP